MTTTRAQRPVRTTDLVRDLAAPPYLFVEHEVEPATRSPYRWHQDDYRTFVVIGGRVRLEQARSGIAAWEYGYLQGWHALPGAVYRFSAVGTEPAVVVEAGSRYGPTHESAEPPADEVAAGAACMGVDTYRVDKPWGHEVWYTHNLEGLPYALKQIHMTAGHQSSLQSHERKVETNYVIAGRATVLNGLPAPTDRTAGVDAAALPRMVCGRRSGWSSAANILHRVIAQSDYTSIEVSTPELDDVIRWADDTNRGNGRIDVEHAGARA